MLGRDDARVTNTFPEHAMRVLEEVVVFRPHRRRWRAEEAV
jgi:hypothetical protein